VKATPRLFCDASMLIASAGSKTGASALVLDLCRHGSCKAVCSQLVLLEAERNIKAKMEPHSLLRFYHEIASLDLELVGAPTADEIVAQRRIIDPKDAHVLAAALKGKTNFLLTLDRKHFMVPAVLEAGLPFSIMTPGDFLHHWLSQTQ
jgi:predicted nucleic acid-binding protein